MGCYASKVKETTHVADHGDHAPGAAGTGNGIEGEPELVHRSTQENSLLHLIRHHRLHPFRRIDKFGLNSSFEVMQLLGRGGTGETYLCKDRRAGGELVAVKLQQRPIPRSTVDMVYNECLVQAMICEGCTFCTTLREVVLTPTHIGLVMEYEAGGNMAEAVSRRVPQVGSLDLVVPEEEARFLFKQLMAGVAYLHSCHTAHRDIKLDNTLLDARQPPTIKLADFQFTYYWGSLEAFKSTQHLGTPVYMCPELIETRGNTTVHAYDPVAADVWAAAVWLVATLVGAFPFDSTRDVDNLSAEREILQQERTTPWQESRFVKPYLGKLSSDCSDLISGMLEPDPERRMSVSAVLRHGWMTKPLPSEFETAWERLQSEQAAAASRVQSLQLNGPVVQERSSALYKLVSEAATEGRDSKRGQHEKPSEELAKIVDFGGVIPGGVCIDMRLRAVGAEILASPQPRHAQGSIN